MVYTICIGSNEEREANLALARRRLEEAFPCICFSREVDTEPLYLGRRALFANQVARFESYLDLPKVKDYLKAIEREAGSTLEERQIEIIRLDIDLLACDEKIYKKEDWEREYVRKGMEELGKNIE